MGKSVWRDAPRAAGRGLRLAAWFLLFGGLLMASGPFLPYSGSDNGFHFGYTNEWESAANLFGAFYSIGGMMLCALAAGAIALSSRSPLGRGSRRALRLIGTFAILIALLCLPFVWWDRIEVAQRGAVPSSAPPEYVGDAVGLGIFLSVSGMVVSLLSSLTLLVLSIKLKVAPRSVPQRSYA